MSLYGAHLFQCFFVRFVSSLLSSFFLSFAFYNLKAGVLWRRLFFSCFPQIDCCTTRYPPSFSDFKRGYCTPFGIDMIEFAGTISVCAYAWLIPSCLKVLLICCEQSASGRCVSVFMPTFLHQNATKVGNCCPRHTILISRFASLGIEKAGNLKTSCSFPCNFSPLSR